MKGLEILRLHEILYHLLHTARMSGAGNRGDDEKISPGIEFPQVERDGMKALLRLDGRGKGDNLLFPFLIDSIFH
jgi:hypothetical protein